MCALLEACGTWGGKLAVPLTARDSEVWRQQSFLTCKAEKNHSAWNAEKKGKQKDHILIKPQRRKRCCLQISNKLQAVETEGRHSAGGKEPREAGRYWGSEPAECYPRFLSSAPEALPSPRWLYLYSHPLWRPDESSVTHWKYPELSTSNYLTLASSERFPLKTRLRTIIYSNNHSFSGLICYPFILFHVPFTSSKLNIKFPQPTKYRGKKLIFNSFSLNFDRIYNIY